jgi:replicative DNA helicase
MRQHFKKVAAVSRKKAEGRRGVAPGDWLLDSAEKLNIIWGTDAAPLVVDGEGFMIVGPQGVGKSTVAEQFTLALAGLRDECLGLPVRRERGKVLYLAMDRPEQIRRSFRRMVTEADRLLLAERLVLWRGPLPFSVVHEPERMAAFAHGLGATHVVVDSYKDLAPKMSDEEAGSQINNAVQECIVEGINWTGVHHNRKANASNPHPKELSDVYGSNWLTAGLGSIISLYGEAGASVVEAKHIKQPAESFGIFGIKHDHTIGHSELTDERPEGSASRGQDKADEIIKVLRDNPDKAFDAHGIGFQIKAGERQVRRYMPKLEEEGLAKRVDTGKRHEWQWSSGQDSSS